uniref:Uncharacterized protein n=1 Tax=Ditylenchus dipsaci TaxID=166011 RepID=A0A915ESX4_9BILA
MCFGCPKWVCPAICCVAFVLLIAYLAFYNLMKPCAKTVKSTDLTFTIPTSDGIDLGAPYVHTSFSKPTTTSSLPKTASTITGPIFLVSNQINGCSIVKGQRKTGMRAGGFMHTRFELICNGTLQGETTLWPEPSFFGLLSGDFSGCSEIHLYAKDHRIWISQQHKFATSPRNESYGWSEQVPNNLLSLVKKFALMHSRC